VEIIDAGYVFGQLTFLHHPTLLFTSAYKMSSYGKAKGKGSSPKGAIMAQPSSSRNSSLGKYGGKFGGFYSSQKGGFGKSMKGNIDEGYGYGYDYNWEWKVQMDDMKNVLFSKTSLELKKNGSGESSTQKRSPSLARKIAAKDLSSSPDRCSPYGSSSRMIDRSPNGRLKKKADWDHWKHARNDWEWSNGNQWDAAWNKAITPKDDEEKKKWDYHDKIYEQWKADKANDHMSSEMSGKVSDWRADWPEYEQMLACQLQQQAMNGNDPVSEDEFHDPFANVEDLSDLLADDLAVDSKKSEEKVPELPYASRGRSSRSQPIISDWQGGDNTGDFEYDFFTDEELAEVIKRKLDREWEILPSVPYMKKFVMGGSRLRPYWVDPVAVESVIRRRFKDDPRMDFFSADPRKGWRRSRKDKRFGRKDSRNRNKRGDSRRRR